MIDIVLATLPRQRILASERFTDSEIMVILSARCITGWLECAVEKEWKGEERYRVKLPDFKVGCSWAVHSFK